MPSILFQLLVKLRSTIHGKGAVDKASLADSGLAFDSYGYNKGEDEELLDRQTKRENMSLSSRTSTLSEVAAVLVLQELAP
jgi:hypothetical protein